MRLFIANLTFILLLATIFGSISAQRNIIPNGSFEAGSGNPDGDNRLDLCNFWETLSNGTADYYSNNGFQGGVSRGPNAGCGFAGDDPTLGNDPMFARTGTRYAGFGPCEGLYVPFEENLRLCSSYKVSFWYSPRCFDQDQEISVYLLTRDVNDPQNGFGVCNNPTDPLIQEYRIPVPVNSTVDNNGDVIHKPGEWIYFESEDINILDDVGFSGLFIKGRFNVQTTDDNGLFGSPDYVYVDDVEMIVTDICDRGCASDNKLTITDFNNGRPSDYTRDSKVPYDIGVIANQRPLFGFRLNNAVSFRLQVFDRWGGLVYVDDRDICSEWYFPCWNGHSTGATNLTLNPSTSSQNLYTYTITASGCNDQEITISGNVGLYYRDFRIGDRVETACGTQNFTNLEPIGPEVYCCPRIERIIDFSLNTSGRSRVNAAQSVLLDGVWVFSNTTNLDRVVVEAGRDITIRNSYTTRQFTPNRIAVFRIADCVFDKRKSEKSINENGLVALAPKSIFVSPPNEINDMPNLSIYPNPSEGLVTIQCSEKIEKVEYYALSGVLLNTISQTVNYSSEISQIRADFSKQNTGVYTVVIYTNSGVFTRNVTISR